MTVDREAVRFAAQAGALLEQARGVIATGDGSAEWRASAARWIAAFSDLLSIEDEAGDAARIDSAITQMEADPGIVAEATPVEMFESAPEDGPDEEDEPLDLGEPASDDLEDLVRSAQADAGELPEMLDAGLAAFEAQSSVAVAERPALSCGVASPYGDDETCQLPQGHRGSHRAAKASW